MNLGDPRNVIITADMSRLMADPYVMKEARKILYEARPLLAYANLDAEGVVRWLAATESNWAKSQVTLSFDGKFLLWREVGGGKIIRHSWSAVSGRPGYQSKEFQDLADKGPIPEGRWMVKQSEYQFIGERSLWEKFKNSVGGGKWPGGKDSWGRHRIWLLPLAGTTTHGRSGFSIHGGSTPGSAGCIDLTDQMEKFIKLFHFYGKDIELTVLYS